MKLQKKLLLKAGFLVLAMSLVFAVGNASAMYDTDGALHGASGGWNLPNLGFCVGGYANQTGSPTTMSQIYTYGTLQNGAPIHTASRDCTALRFPDYNTLSAASVSCVQASNLANTSGSGIFDWTGGRHSWTTACTLTSVHGAPTNSSTCASAGGVWNQGNTPANGLCAVTLDGFDTGTLACGAVTGAMGGGTGIGALPYQCVAAGWSFPPATAANYPPYGILTVSTNPVVQATSFGASLGDQCARCHDVANSDRSTYSNLVAETYLQTGHKNASRLVTPTAYGSVWTGDGYPWAAPSGTLYTIDSSGNALNFGTGKDGTSTMYFIYGGWLSIGQCTDTLYTTAAACTSHGLSWNASQKVCYTSYYPTSGACASAGLTWVAQAPHTFTSTTTAGTYDACFDCHATGWGTTSTVGEPTNTYAGFVAPHEWDSFGVVCSRCHGSEVTAFGSTADTGSSTHHTNMTTHTAAALCTNPSLTTQAGCTAGYNWDGSNAQWLAANTTTAVGYCSLTGHAPQPAYTTAALCTSGQVTGTGNNNPYGAGLTLGYCSYPYYTTTATCTAAGFSWVPGGMQCANPAYTTQYSCTNTNLGATNWYVGTWNFANAQQQMMVTNKCMECHRAEQGLNVPDVYGGLLTGNPAQLQTSYSSRNAGYGGVRMAEFSQGNQFLNSPHALFTGTSLLVGSGAYGNGYNSVFEGAFGETFSTYPNNGGGCTTCHAIHDSANIQATGEVNDGFVKTCDDCHAGPVYGKPLNMINHPGYNNGGTGGYFTPFDSRLYGNVCAVCHMGQQVLGADSLHVFRINTSASYSTWPTSTVESLCNTYSSSEDPAYTLAVGVDLDIACGQCHGGGASSASPTFTKIDQAPYFSKAELAVFAPNMHSGTGAGITPPTTPTCGGLAGSLPASVQLGSSASFTDASSPAATPLYVNWGDGSPFQIGNTGGHFTYTYTNAGYYKVVATVNNQGWTCSQSATVQVIRPTGGSGTNTFTVTSGASSSGAKMTVQLYQDVANPTTVPNSLVGDGNLLVNGGALTLTSLAAVNPGPNYQVYLYYPTGESCTPTGLTADAKCPSGLTNSGASTVGACGSAAPGATITVLCTP